MLLYKGIFYSGCMYFICRNGKVEDILRHAMKQVYLSSALIGSQSFKKPNDPFSQNSTKLQCQPLEII